MRIVITISDPPLGFDRYSLSLESPAYDFEHYVTIAQRTDGTWSAISHGNLRPPNLSPSKRAPEVTVDVKP